MATKKKKKKSSGGRKKPRSAAQRAATKRMLAANRAKRGGGTAKRKSGKRKGAKRSASKGHGHHKGLAKEVHALKSTVHRHIAADQVWKRKQAVINTIAISSIKGLYNSTRHAQPGALRALPVGAASSSGHRRLGAG